MTMRLIQTALTLIILVPALSVGCGRTIDRNVDDVGITTRVKTALLNEPNLSAGGIEVETSNGVVTLTGTVRSEAERSQAVTVARRINGVTDVRSSLSVAG